MTISIRRASIEDMSQLRPLYSAYRVFYECESDPAGEESYLRERMDNGDAIVFASEDEGGSLVGFTLLYQTFDSVEMGSIWVLHDLFVDPSARRQGIARQLMMTAHDFCREQGACRVDLATAVTNIVAQPLYESLGYERDTEFYFYSKSLK